MAELEKHIHILHEQLPRRPNISLRTRKRVKTSWSLFNTTKLLILCQRRERKKKTKHLVCASTTQTKSQ